MCKNISKRAKWCKVSIRTSFKIIFSSYTIRTSSEKQREHAGISFTSLSLMRPVNWKTLHLTFIISVSRSSEMLYFPTCLMIEDPVASIGMSLEIKTSFAKWFFGARKWTFWPSNRRRKSSRWINSGLHLRLLIRIISASSEPTHANLSRAGL